LRDETLFSNMCCYCKILWFYDAIERLIGCGAIKVVLTVNQQMLHFYNIKGLADVVTFFGLDYFS